MTAGRNVARALATALVTVTVLVVGFSGSAMAAAPELIISQPLAGSFKNSPTPSFTGMSNDTADPITLKIYVGASVGETPVQTLTQLVPVEVSPGEATWGLTPETALADGQYTAVAEQTNATSETGASTPVTFTVDTTAPAVSINAPSSPTKESEPTLTGGLGVEAGDLPSVSVTIYEGSSTAGNLVASGSATVTAATWSYMAPHLASGTYTAQASQSDEAGNIATSAAVTFRVDTTKPLVTMNALTSPTKSPEPTLTGAGGVAVGDEPTVTVTIYQGTSVGGTIEAAGGVTVKGGAWSYTSPHLADGTYTAQVTQSDEAGNVGGSTAVTFRVDTTAPAVSMNAVMSPTKSPELTLSGGIGVAIGDLASVTVTIHEGTTPSGKTVASGSATVNATTWSYAAPHLADGTYTAQASQRDEAGNVGTSAVTFRVDTTKPAVSINPVLSPSKDAEPSMGGAAGVALGDGSTVTVKIYEGATVGGTLAQLTNVPVSNGTWSYAASHLADGTYTAQASQSDEAGNVGTSGTETFTIDTTAPAVTLNPVVSSTNDSTPTLTGTGGIATGDPPSVTVMIYAGASAAGNPIASASVPVKAGAWTYTSSHLADGTYTAEVSQEDDVGNVGTTAPVTFRVDTKAPAVSIKAPASPSNATQPTITGDAGIELGDEPSVTVTIYEGGSVNSSKKAASGSATVSGQTWSYQTPISLAEGTYTAQASQSDEAGNVGTSAAVTFTIDTTPPQVSLKTPADGDELSVSKPSFSGLAGHAVGDEPLVTLDIYEGATATGEPYAIAVIKPEGEHWASDATALPNGEYTAVAEQLDDAGNTGKSNPVTFTVHTVLSLDTAGFVRRQAGLFTGPTPSFNGIAVAAKEDTPSVTLRIFAGESPSGVVVEEMSGAVGESGDWTVGPVSSLQGGTYTVQAEQSSSHEKFFLSAPITFTADAQAPQITLTAPANGSSTTSTSPTLSGSAGSAEGDLATITTHVYAGATTAGTLVQTVSVQASGGSWSSSVGPLSPGEYTAQAEQGDDVGNIGDSEAVTFTVTQLSMPVSEPSSPLASFKWVPGAPNAGEPVTLISTSTDASAPITGYAWSLAGNSVFTQGESSLTTSFATPGLHVVQLSITNAAGQSTAVAETIPVSTAPVPLMQPFPVVHMAGSYNARGAKITVLSVLAPVGAKVVITCRGSHCPTKSLAFLATAGAKSKSGTALITFKRFERPLRGGVVLSIWVSKTGEIGKFTRFTIRRGKSPTRVDECLNPAGTTPIVCPS
ncbi:MAG TPA: Ig-like domain-containing protein [Solirubrobacteraceae bacterium]|nr:Ig-like domain-containing protein [Solirubrobacteraceae bacterium]